MEKSSGINQYILIFGVHIRLEIAISKLHVPLPADTKHTMRISAIIEQPKVAVPKFGCTRSRLLLTLLILGGVSSPLLRIAALFSGGHSSKRLNGIDGARLENVTALHDREHSTVKYCLTAEFKKYGSDLHNIRLSPNLDRRGIAYPSLVLVASGSKRYKYIPSWISHRIQERTPFVLFTTSGTLRNNELAAHYGRMPSLLASMVCMPKVWAFVYTDLDTLVDFSRVESLARQSSRAVTMTWKPPLSGSGKTLRTNWFVVKNCRPESFNFLMAWYYNGRPAFYQDQTVLNELYAQKIGFGTLYIP